MTKKELEKMIALHTALRDRVRHIFVHHYDDMSDEERDRWFKDLTYQNEVLAWLADEKPDVD